MRWLICWGKISDSLDKQNKLEAILESMESVS